MQLKEVLKIVQTIDNECQALNKELERRRDSLETALAAQAKQQHEAAAANPNPWHRFPQLLNRAEYERTIETMFGIPIDASAYLPPETISDNFDNITDVQTVSVSLLEGYMNAADAVARAAIGDPNATPRQQVHHGPTHLLLVLRLAQAEPVAVVVTFERAQEREGFGGER